MRVKRERKHEPMLLGRWCSMHARCKTNNPHTNYTRLGIKVCEEWSGENGFENFYQWSVSNGASPELVIDRIDTYGDYSPLNCRWVSATENNRNKANTVYVCLEGETVPLTKACEILGYGAREYSRVYQKIRRGTPPEEALGL